MSLPLSVYKRMPKRMSLSLGFDRYALHIDGDYENNYVEVTNLPAFEKVVVEVIAKKVVSKNEWDVLVARWSNDFRDIHLSWQRQGDNKITMYFAFSDGTSDYVHDSEEVVLGKWYHILAAYDGDTMYLIVDGVLKSSKSVGKTLGYNTEGKPLRLGVKPDPDWPYPSNSVIALFRLYDSRVFNWLSVKGLDLVWLARYNMLNYHNPIREGLVLWFDLEEGHGDKVYDKSGNGYHGTIYGLNYGVRWVRVRQYELRAEVGL